jgi:hypothetical protein
LNLQKSLRLDASQVEMIDDKRINGIPSANHLHLQPSKDMSENEVEFCPCNTIMRLEMSLAFSATMNVHTLYPNTSSVLLKMEPGIG